MGLVAVTAGREDPVAPADTGEVGLRRPHARPQPRQEGRAEAGRLQLVRAVDGDADLVGLHLAEQIVGGSPSIDRERGEIDSTFLRHEIDHVTHLEGDGLESGAHDVRARGAARDADDEPACIGIPVRGSETGERGHEDHTAAVGHGLCDRLGLARGFDDAEAVAQPLHGRTRDEDSPFECVGERAVRPAESHGREKA